MVRRREPQTIEAGTWGERRGRPRVLVENPDAAQLWAYAETLREDGYDVATCPGEHPDGSDRCPLIETGRCTLVEGADVVVTTCAIGRSDRLLEVLGLIGSPPVVFEAPRPAFARWAELAGDATLLPEPVTTRELLEAADRARRGAPGPEAATRA
jgi:hypothetical protein